MTRLTLLLLLFASAASAQTRPLVQSGGDGTIEVAEDGDNISLQMTGTRPAASVPAAATANYMNDTPVVLGELVLPGHVDENGLFHLLQPALFGTRWCMWGLGGSSGPAAIGCGMTVTGSAGADDTLPAWAVTNTRTRLWRTNATCTAGTGVQVEWRNNSSSGFWRGNAAGLGGFIFVVTFAEGATILDGQRALVGLMTTANGIGANETIASQVDFVGFCHEDDGAGGNWSICHNDSADAATITTLGASFPSVNTTAYEGWIWAPPNASSIYYYIINLSSGVVASGELTTNLPSNASALWQHISVDSGSTNGAPVIEFGQAYLGEFRHLGNVR